MAYDGEEIYACPPDYYFRFNVYVVVVSGGAWNPCGHAILYSSYADRYFHVAGLYSRPRSMDARQHERYMRENGKHELRRYQVMLRNPAAAHRKLEELLSKPWGWWGVPHNCATFCEDVVRAGGSHAGLYSNCPSREAFR
jgi:hypothetical protein